jgi:type IV secretory pathway VirD2 relaxase
LKQFTREFMSHVSRDLETRLDWVAVDHWDTDNPHTHIVLRGRAADGTDLVIAPDYMAHGMRLRASDIITQWLGPRTELEIQESLRKETAQERFTSLDRALLGTADEGVVDLGALQSSRRDHLQLRGRLQRLETMGVAEKLATDRWRLASNMREVLVAMGERGDIVRAVNLALKGAPREIRTGGIEQEPIIGRVAGKGLADELSDRAYLIVDGIDGRAHYVRMSHGANLSELTHGAVVEVRAGPRSHQRVTVLSRVSVQEQIGAEGPTWLDRQLIRGTSPAPQGFGALVREGLKRRVEELESRGLMQQDNPATPSRNLLEKLRVRELAAKARELSARLAKPCVALDPRGLPRAKLAQELKLASGRFAVLEWERGFSIVPWTKQLEASLMAPGIHR